MTGVVISGMLVGNRRDNLGDYSDVEFIYNVEPGITAEDVRYFFNKAISKYGVREVPAKTDGTKLSFMISVDSDYRPEGRMLNRVALGKAIMNDVKNTDLTPPIKPRR